MLQKEYSVINSLSLAQDELLAGAPEGLEPININDLVNVVLNVLDARDPYTFNHSLRVTEIATMIAKSMELPKEQIKTINEAAYLHDIGKIGIPDRVLNKAGRLSTEEMQYMQAHPRIGFNILNRLPLFKNIANIVLNHHERWDGFGYPNGIKGTNIPIESRIIAVSDAFDAITSDRPYRKGQTHEFGVEEILKHKNDQFDPIIVEHFLKQQHTIPRAIDNINADTVPHAFDGHDELMHSRRLV